MAGGLLSQWWLRVLDFLRGRNEDTHAGMDRTDSGQGTLPMSAPVERPVLRGLSEIYRYFRESTTPIYFVSPTAYNILGIDDWVSSFRYVCYFDSFDGADDHIFVPTHAGPREFETFESVNTYLLGHKEVIDRIRKGGPTTKGVDNVDGPAYVLFVMFDEETERLAEQLGLTIALPPRELRERIDSKIETTRLGNEAGVASAPNVMTRCDSYAELSAAAHEAGLGDRLVVQLPYGDSGRTTFFIDSQADWDAHADVLVDDDLKVMKNIRHLPGTVEAVATRHGTLVGPVQVDLTGFDELTPYKGGWCGNDCAPISFGAANQERIREMARKLGDRLYAEGYRGVFCMDYLIDLDDDTVYLGEINPRISGRFAAHEPHHVALRRSAALPVPPARVHGRGLGVRPRGGAEPVARLRPLEPAGAQADDRRGRDHHAGAPERPVADGRGR